MVVTELLREVYPYLRVGPSTVSLLFVAVTIQYPVSNYVHPENSCARRREQHPRSHVRCGLLKPNHLHIVLTIPRISSSVMYKLHDHLITHPAQAITLRASMNIQGKHTELCTSPSPHYFLIDSY